MPDSWQSPKYAPNSDVEDDVEDDTDSSDFGGSLKPDPKGVPDPWNDPEDDDDEDDEDAPQRQSSPDYLGGNTSNETRKPRTNAAWDALSDDEDDEDEDGIPPGISVGGMETKSSVGNGNVTPVPNGEVSGADHSDSQRDTEEPHRKRQRLNEETGSNGRLNSGMTDTPSGLYNTSAQRSHPPPGPQPGVAPPSNPMGRNQHGHHSAHHPAHRPSPHPIPGLIMPSFFGIRPRDEFVRIIGAWLLRVCQGLPGVEIEIKLGTLVDKHTKRRISLPCLSETILPENFDCLFLSEMTQRQHATLNYSLNKEVEYCSGKAGPHPTLEPGTYYPITYKHTYTTDTSYPASQVARDSGYPHAKRRVTTDDKTGQVVACIEKTKIANLNIFSPNEEFDWRVSVNMEVPAEVQQHEKPVHSRRKDRVTYKHSLFQVDLTQVNKPTTPRDPPAVHELEIEVINAVDLLTQGWNDGQGLPSTFEPQLESLLNTVRLLNRNAGPKFSQAPKRPQQSM